MQRSRLLGWIPPVIIVLAIGVYAGAVAAGRWRDPAPGEPGAVKAYPESTDPGQRKAQAELCPLINNSPLKGATLLVAWDRADSGGMVELTILRETAAPGDEGALTRIAERQLPGLPGRPA